MKLEPVITEKSMKDAGNGKYTFRVPDMATKSDVRKNISEIFNVHVQTVRTMNVKGEKKRGFSKYPKQVPGYKKAIVTLAEKETIDLFEVKK
jgi:large subunit ribosomal protein L23